jgi:hypothetical protein
MRVAGAVAVVMITKRHHQPTTRHGPRRTAEATGEWEIRRWLERMVGQQLFRLLARTKGRQPPDQAGMRRPAAGVDAAWYVGLNV